MLWPGKPISPVLYYFPVGWTIFTTIDLFVGAFLIDMMSTTVPPEKLPRLRRARNVMLILFGISVVVLGVQIARKYGWI
jgi:hypothetical protein